MERPLSNRLLPTLIVALALGGAWVCGTLLSAHDGGWGNDSSGSGFLLELCNSPEVASARCAEVIDGRWGAFDVTIAGRRVVVPTSFVGLAYFAGLALWLAIPGLSAMRFRWSRALTLLVVSGGLCASIFLTVLMAFALHEWCLLCVIAHAINAAIFVGIVWLRSGVLRECQTQCQDVGTEENRAAAGVMLERRLLFSGAATALLAVGGLWLYLDAVTVAKRYFRRSASIQRVIDRLQDDREFMLREYRAQPVVDMPLRAVGEEGSADRLALVVFGRFDCPPCRCFAGRRRRLIEPAFGGELLVEHRHALPAPVVGSGETEATMEYATLAGMAAEAARLQGGDQAFWRMHDLLLKYQHHRRHDFAVMGERIGLDGDRLVSDMHGAAVRRVLREDAALAEKLGVSSTPAVFLNNRRVPDLCIESEVFWEAVAGELASRRSGLVACRGADAG